MSKDLVTGERQGHVLLIGLNRPEKRNALSLDMYWQLAKAYGELHQDPDLSAACCLPTGIISQAV